MCSVHPMRGEKRRRTGNRVNNTPFGQSDRSSSYTILHQRKIERFFIFEGIFYIQEGTAFVAFAFFSGETLASQIRQQKGNKRFTLKRQLVLRYARLHIITNATLLLFLKLDSAIVALFIHELLLIYGSKYRGGGF